MRDLKKFLDYSKWNFCVCVHVCMCVFAMMMIFFFIFIKKSQNQSINLPDVLQFDNFKMVAHLMIFDFFFAKRKWRETETETERGGKERKKNKKKKDWRIDFWIYYSILKKKKFEIEKNFFLVLPSSSGLIETLKTKFFGCFSISTSIILQIQMMTKSWSLKKWANST